MLNMTVKNFTFAKMLKFLNNFTFELTYYPKKIPKRVFLTFIILKSK